MKKPNSVVFKTFFFISIFSLFLPALALVARAQDTAQIVGTSTDQPIPGDLPVIEKPGTVESLNTVLDYVTSHVSSDLSGSAYCTRLTSVMTPMSDNARSSLAWNESSYTWVFALKTSETLPENQQALFDETKSAYEKISPALTGMIVKSETVDYYDRRKAVVRSALVGIASEASKETEVNGARIQALHKLLGGAYECLKSETSDTSLESEAVKASDTALVSLASVWDASKSGFNVAPEAEVTHISLDAKTVRTAGAVEGAPATSEEVASMEDLSLYAKSHMVENAHIRQVESDAKATVTTYNQRGKFLGFIPVWMKVKTTVVPVGVVKVKYPWYSGISKVIGGKVQTASVVEALGEAKPETLTPADQAMALHATVSVFEAKEVK